MHESDGFDVGKTSYDFISPKCDVYSEVSGLRPAAPERRSGRQRDEQKRKLIGQAMDEGIRPLKQIQLYVAEKLNTGLERVSRKMISEVRKTR